MKTISIVTPSFNQGKYLEQTILSVLNQSGDFYIDYIIADGGSTDQSVEIIKKYDTALKTGEFPIKCLGIELRWWSKKDSGQSNALNQGFKLAKGEILAWINSDDFYEPEAFSNIVKYFEKNPEIDMLYGDGFNFYQETGEKILRRSVPTNFSDILRRCRKIFQPSTFFTKKIMSEMGLLDESLHYVMDFEYWVRILKTGKSLYIPIPLSNFRLWTDSKTVSQSQKFSAERRKVFKKYGGNIIDPIFVRNVINFKLFSPIRKLFPIFSRKVEEKVNSLSDKFHY